MSERAPPGAGTFMIECVVHQYDKRIRYYSAPDRETALALVENDPPDLALVDYRFHGEASTSILLIEELRAICPDAFIVLFTVAPSAVAADRARDAGANATRRKTTPFAKLAALAEGRCAPEADDDLPTLEHVMWDYCERVVHECDGNLSQAARKLDISRKTLKRRLESPPTR